MDHAFTYESFKGSWGRPSPPLIVGKANVAVFQTMSRSELKINVSSRIVRTSSLDTGQLDHLWMRMLVKLTQFHLGKLESAIKIKPAITVCKRCQKALSYMQALPPPMKVILKRFSGL